MKKLLYISALVLSALACGVNTQLPYSQNTPEVSTGNFSNDSSTARMVVRVDEALNVRDGANGTETGEYKHDGDLVTIYHITVVGETHWCAITPDWTRWVACRYLKGK